MTDAEVNEIDAGIDAAKDRLTADPNLRFWLKLVKTLGVTLEEAKWRYGQEKAFRETAHLLWAEDVIEAESLRKFGSGHSFGGGQIFLSPARGQIYGSR